MDDLSVRELRHILAQVEYMPGWEMSVYESVRQGIYWRVTAIVENSYEPGTTVTLDIKSPLPPMSSEEEFLTWLSWRLGSIAVHESHEWFRWKNGKAVFDPHAEGVDEPRAGRRHDAAR